LLLDWFTNRGVFELAHRATKAQGVVHKLPEGPLLEDPKLVGANCLDLSRPDTPGVHKGKVHAVSVQLLRTSSLASELNSQKIT
jgi:hypothetical protein